MPESLIGDFPFPPTDKQMAEHRQMLDRKRRQRADELGITVEELDRRIDAGEPLDQ